MAFGSYSYGGYPGPGGYYSPPVPDQLAQLRQGAYQQPVLNQPVVAAPVAQQAMQQVPNVQPQPAMTGPVFVNGEAGAKGYLVGAGNTVMLIDADPDANTFWLKSADASGMPSMRTFDYKERIAAPATSQPAKLPSVDYVTRDEFEALEAKLDAISAKKTAPKKSTREDADNE